MPSNQVFRNRIHRWLRRLKKEEQCSGFLHSSWGVKLSNRKGYIPRKNDTHCCIGVAELCMPVELRQGSYQEIEKYFGYTSADADHLVKLNDKDNKDFEYIGQWIEENILVRYED